MVMCVVWCYFYFVFIAMWFTEKFSIWLVLFMIIVWVFFLVWRIKSIVRFVWCDFDAPVKCEIVYWVWTFVPFIGGVVGHMDFKDK